MKDKKTVYSRFREWVAAQPEAVAIVEDGREVTYAELDAMADAVIARCRALRRGAMVGIVMHHCAEMIASMLAVMKSGAAYVPAEPSLPKERIDYMMEAAGVRLVITDATCRNLAQAEVRRTYLDRSRPGSPAYVLFTSGTTGRPKGIVVENHSVVNYTEAFEAEFHISPADVMLQYSVCSFDIFVEEVFATLLNGATLAIPSAEVMRGGIGELMAFVERHGVTIISGFPYLLADMNRRASIPASLRLLISGGDVLRASYIDRLRHSGAMIYNTYGPSETTVCASYARCDNAEPLADATFSIGREIKGVEIRILGPDLEPLRQGEEGEICILGEGVARGYIGCPPPPEQANFVMLADGRRLYRSGDMGRRLADGSLAFLGRRDDQVMILGRRVETDEVENVLNAYPEVEHGVVCHYNDGHGLPYLVAYFVPRDARCTLSAVKHWLASKLADFMVPEFFVAMRSIPLTVRGKVDRRALPRVNKD